MTTVQLLPDTGQYAFDCRTMVCLPVSGAVELVVTPFRITFDRRETIVVVTTASQSSQVSDNLSALSPVISQLLEFVFPDHTPAMPTVSQWMNGPAGE
jgi:hypothetical protein